MIGTVSILQMPLPRYVDWFIALCNRPIRCLFLRLEVSHFLTADDDGMVDSICTWVGGQRSVLDIRGGHKIHSLNVGEQANIITFFRFSGIWENLNRQLRISL
jgi:hypothetical protein